MTGPGLAGEVVRLLVDQERTIAVAESLTGGLLVAELISVPGASVAVLGGVVAYSAALKHSVLGVSKELLSVQGPVHPDVAAQMAERVRAVLAVDGRPASVGVGTTGVAGPGPQDGHPAGTVFVGFATDGGTTVLRLVLAGDRAAIRAGVVSESLSELRRILRAG